MRGRTIKDNEPKTPKENANTSAIRKHLTKDGSPKSPGIENQQQGDKEIKKTLEKERNFREDISTESEMETSKMDEQGACAQMPTKLEMTYDHKTREFY